MFYGNQLIVRNVKRNESVKRNLFAGTTHGRRTLWENEPELWVKMFEIR